MNKTINGRSDNTLNTYAHARYHHSVTQSQNNQKKVMLQHNIHDTRGATHRANRPWGVGFPEPLPYKD